MRFAPRRRTCCITCLCCSARAMSRSPRSSANSKAARGTAATTRKLPAEPDEPRRRRVLEVQMDREVNHHALESPFRRFTRDEWAKLRADTAADADDRRSAQAAVDPRSDFARRGRGDLSAAVAPAGALRRGDAGPVQGDAALPRRRRRQGALHHRRRRLGGGRQVDHRARAAGAADALAEHAEGPAGDDRRLPASRTPNSSATG